MTTVGYLFVFVALLLVRQVFKGRVMNIGEDLTDSFIAVVSGDTDALGEVLTRTGDANKANESVTGNGQPQASDGNGIAGVAVTLGKAAKGYRWGSTGPEYYDCSGLMWRACQKVGYTGPRFVTATVMGMPGFKRIAAPATQGPNLIAATVNDLVVWPGHHMGVITGPNKFYSARNPKAGIGYANISGFRKDAPIYLRFTHASK